MGQTGNGMIEHEPYASSALWSRRLGLFAIPVSIIAVVAQRSGQLDFNSGVASLGAGAILAVLAVLLGLIAFAVIWVRGNRGAGAAAIGIIAGLAVISVPLGYLVMGWGLPQITDVATDPGDPPAFVFAAAERRPTDNPLAYPGEKAAMAQLSGYPDIAPLRVSQPVDEVYALALQLVETRGWRILVSGANNRGRRHIEAVALTPLLRFSEDIAIDIRPEGGGVRVDMRSASRVGSADLGSNARRVRSFLTDLAAAAR